MDAGVDFLVFNFDLRRLMFVFLQVTNFDQRGPDFKGRVELAHDVVHNPADILLEEIGFKTIK